MGEADTQHPLQHFGAVVLPVRTRLGERELVLGVVVLLQVKQDGGGLEDGEVVAVGVDNGGDAAVGVDLRQNEGEEKGVAESARTREKARQRGVGGEEMGDRRHNPEGRDRPFGTDLDEPRLLLRVLANIDGMDVVVELAGVGGLKLLQEDGHFLVSPDVERESGGDQLEPLFVFGSS